MTLYFDTAYIAKCYLNEPDGREVRKLARNAKSLTSSVWCILELSCVLHRHMREDSLTAAQAENVWTLFLADLRSGVWNLLPLPERIANKAAGRVIELPANVFLRAGDALHLMTARDAGFTEIWSNDRHLIAAAPHFGLTTKQV